MNKATEDLSEDHPPLIVEGYQSEGAEARTLVARDAARPLAERLEAFEDLVDSEVGDTTFTRARNIERTSGLRQLWIKFEGGNPTGTHKDRIAHAQVADAMRRGYEAITVASCGNYGAAMSVAATAAGINCIVMIPESFHSRRIGEIQELGAEIIRTPGDYENAVALSQDLARTRELYDANPGGDNTTIQLHAYSQIAYEIYDDLRDAPAAVAVAVSNGTTLAGIHRGFVSLYRRGKTSRIPRMIAGSSFNKNPIIRAFRRGSETCDDLVPGSIHETAVNEPGQLALHRRRLGAVGDPSDSRVRGSVERSQAA